MLSGTPTPRGTGDLVRFATGSAGTFSFASRFIFSSSHPMRCSALRGASPPPARPPAAGTCTQDDKDEVDVSVAWIGFGVIEGPEGVGNIGGVDVVPVFAAAASESSSLTEALGPRLEPLDPVITGVSPFGGFGLLLWTPSL